ncbi:hypothetical protein O3P69_011889 [Scylla paramamosain]|uniref:Uncharacterized protein n=1 Tax=Scylla paramamosain TaxID=85552 RepID=A0AAW0SAG9_SCYPA
MWLWAWLWQGQWVGRSEVLPFLARVVLLRQQILHRGVQLNPPDASETFITVSLSQLQTLIAWQKCPVQSCRNTLTVSTSGSALQRRVDSKTGKKKSLRGNVAGLSGTLLNQSSTNSGNGIIRPSPAGVAESGFGAAMGESSSLPTISDCEESW